MPTKVAFQGVPGAYSEQAAETFFGKGSVGLPCDTFDEAFRAVRTGKVPYGVLPIENSLTGSIHQNFDLLMKEKVWICGEVKLRISHCLIAPRGTRLKDVRRVYSHPQGLWQCQGFLRRLKVELVPYFDTAGSVRLLKEEKPEQTAAVASQRAARHYGMKVLKNAIEDNKHNFTRFIVLCRKPRKVTGRKVKTSLAFALPNVPGALYKTLAIFSLWEIQLLKIESRPIPGRPWEYFFYLDVAGNASEGNLKKCLEVVKPATRQFRWLGSYAPAEG